MQFLKILNQFEWKNVMNKSMTNRISYFKKILSFQKTYKKRKLEDVIRDDKLYHVTLVQVMIVPGDN